MRSDEVPVMIQRSSRPGDGAFHSGGNGRFLAGPRRAFVKGHDDVRAQSVLDFDRFLRSEKEFAAIEMRPELDTCICNASQFGETEDLEAAAIGQDRLVPVHELVQSAKLLEDIHARPQEKMICVGEDDVGAHRIEIARCYGLDRGLRADRHVLRRLDGAMAGRQASTARPAARISFSASWNIRGRG